MTTSAADIEGRRQCRVTGGASGIGRALAERFAAAGARGVVVADINAEWAQKVAGRIGGLGIGCDVAHPGSIDELVRATHGSFGPIDIFCSNAGFTDSARRRRDR